MVLTYTLTSSSGFFPFFLFYFIFFYWFLFCSTLLDGPDIHTYELFRFFFSFFILFYWFLFCSTLLDGPDINTYELFRFFSFLFIVLLRFSLVRGSTSVFFFSSVQGERALARLRTCRTPSCLLTCITYILYMYIGI